MLESLKTAIQRWDWQLFLSILFYMLLPRIYESYSIYLIGNVIPDTRSLPIVAQWSSVSLVIEVLQEAMVMPLFFFIGGYVKEKNSILNHIKTSIGSIFIASIILTSLLLLFIDRFIDIIGTPIEIQQETKSYLMIKTVSIPFSILTVAAIYFSESLNLKSIILKITVLKVIVSGLFDSIFFGGYSFSLNYGTDGVAWSNLLSEVVVFLVTILLISKVYKFSAGQFFSPPFFVNWKTLFTVGGWSGLDSLIRNLAYSILIVRMINLIGTKEIGGYYLAMHIFWGFLLVPVLAFSESAKALLSNHMNDQNSLKKYFGSSLVIAILLALLFIGFAPFWGIISNFLNKDPDIVHFSFIAFSLLLIPYALFILNTVSDSLFYATGKTQFMAYQSIGTNAVVYGTAFLLYISELWIPTFESVLLLFAIGIFFDSILTALFAWHILYRKK